LRLQHPPQRFLKSLAATCDVISKRGIDQSLIASAAGSIDASAKPIEDVPINTDCDSRLPDGFVSDGITSPTSAKVVLLLHRFAASP
jgi:hypothetical protein